MCHCNERNYIPKEFYVISLTPKTEEAKRKKKVKKEEKRKEKRERERKWKERERKLLEDF